MTERIEIRTPDNNYLFWLFKRDDGTYRRAGLLGSKKISPKSLGYTKQQLDKLWVVGLPIIDLSLV